MPSGFKTEVDGLTKGYGRQQFFHWVLALQKGSALCDRLAMDLYNAEWLRPCFLPTTTVAAILLENRRLRNSTVAT
jgi:hypothetical protein